MVVHKRVVQIVHCVNRVAYELSLGPMVENINVNKFHLKINQPERS